MSVEPLSEPDGIRVLHASGEVDVVVAEEMLESSVAMIGDARAVVLDLSDVSFFDSSGLRLVERLTRLCRERALPLRVVAIPGTPPRRVLELVGMVTPSTVDALDTALAQLRDS